MVKNKVIDIIGVCSDFGASTQGSSMGANAIRIAGVTSAVKELGYCVRDCGDIFIGFRSTEQENTKNDGAINKAKKVDETKPLNNVKQVNEVNTQLYEKVSKTLKDGHFPVILGGDHSLAAASCIACQKSFKKIGVIWVDAHGDFNNDESSPSGNIHGMPLSAITGNGPDQILPFMEQGTDYIDPKNVAIIGARALDEQEKERLKKAGVTVYSMSEIDKLGINFVMQKAAKIASEGTEGVYLSFDLDALDPSIAQGVGTPVSGGLSYREAHYLCEYLYQHTNLIGCEMLELNPTLDQKNQTAHLALALITSTLGKTIY